MLEGPTDRLLVHVGFVGLALHPRVDRLAVALDAAWGGGPERLAGIGVAIAPDVPDEPATAGRAGQQPRQAVLAAVDRAPVPAAVSGAHRLDVLPGRRVDDRAQGGRLARPESAGVERVGQHFGDVLEGETSGRADLAVGQAGCCELVDPADDGERGLVDV